MLKRYFWLILFIGAVGAAVLNFQAVLTVGGKVLAVLKPLFIGLFIAVVLNIAVGFFEKKVFRLKGKKQKFALPLSIAVTYILFLSFIGLVIYAVVPQLIQSIKGLIAKLPDYVGQAEGWLEGVLTRWGVGAEAIETVKRTASEKVTSMLNGTVEKLPELLAALITGVNGFFNIFFALILSVYMIADKKRLTEQIKKIINSLFPERISKKITDISAVSLTVFSKFIGGQLFEALLLGVVTFVGMLILKLPYPLLVAVIVMITNIIPLLGAYLGGIISLVLILFISFKQAVVFLIFSIIIQQLENNLTYPKVVGKSLGLSGFWVLSAALIGGGLFGFWGIMLGVPAVAVVYKLIGRRIEKNPQPSALVPEFLNQAAKEAGGDASDEAGD